MTNNPYFRKVTQAAGLNNSYVKKIYVRSEEVKQMFLDSSTYNEGLNITRWGNIGASKWEWPVPETPIATSPIKIITSNTVPNEARLFNGELAFGIINGVPRLYGNTGTEILELTSS